MYLALPASFHVLVNFGRSLIPLIFNSNLMCHFAHPLHPPVVFVCIVCCYLLICLQAHRFGWVLPLFEASKLEAIVRVCVSNSNEMLGPLITAIAALLSLLVSDSISARQLERLIAPWLD